MSSTLSVEIQAVADKVNGEASITLGQLAEKVRLFEEASRLATLPDQVQTHLTTLASDPALRAINGGPQTVAASILAVHVLRERENKGAVLAASMALLAGAYELHHDIGTRAAAEYAKRVRNVLEKEDPAALDVLLGAKAEALKKSSPDKLPKPPLGMVPDRKRACADLIALAITKADTTEALLRMFRGTIEPLGCDLADMRAGLVKGVNYAMDILEREVADAAD